MRKTTRKTTRSPGGADGAARPRPRRRLSGKTRRRLAGGNPYAAPHYGPTDSFQHMEEEMVNIYRALFGLVTCAALIPFVLVYMAIDEIARRKRRRAYYEREKERRIELADKKRMKLGEYAKIGDLAEGDDGKYYVYDREEFARRVALESERRRIRRHETTNKCPTSAELKAQWARVKESHVEMLRFGSMLCDLEAYVDNGIMFDGNGDFAGRKPGVKGWLTEHCPEIRARYVTAMRYKAMAVRARQAIGMDEPNPLDAVLGGLPEAADDGPARAGGGADGGCGGMSPAIGGRLVKHDEILRLNTGCEDTGCTEQNQCIAGKSGNDCRCGNDCKSGNDCRCGNDGISENDRRCDNDCRCGNDSGSNDGGESIANGAADGRMAEWRRKLKEILDDAERRDGRVRRRGGRPRKNAKKDASGNGGANGGKNAGDTIVVCGEAPEVAGSVGKGKAVAIEEKRMTQTALVLALEAVSEPLWALVKSVGTGEGAQSA